MKTNSTKRRFLGIRFLLLLSALVCAGLGYWISAGSHSLRLLSDETAMHVIDVGQGDSILLQSGRQAVLIDAGEPDQGQAVVSYLQQLGVHTLYAVIATHPHADHIGGMADVLDSFPVQNFYATTETATTVSYQRMLDGLEAHHISIQTPQDGDTLTFSSGAKLTFYLPSGGDITAENTNNHSLICRFDAGDYRVLLMGDAEAAEEQALLRQHPLLSCDVLKVGHHGSGSSSTPAFLSRIHPETAVISCGKNNDYGHPSPSTLKNLTNAGVQQIHITAEEGTVVIPLSLQQTKENAS